MNSVRLRSFFIRHRFFIRDASLIVAIVVVGAYLLLDFDLFENPGAATVRERTLELDESLLLGGVVALVLLYLCIRRYVVLKREIARRTAAEQHVRTLAFQDVLTGLSNRRYFDDALRAACDAPPRAGAVHAVLLLDLNGFKQINDVYGHGTGDEVLNIVAQRLLSILREGDLAARLGGDEFAILALHLDSPEAATNIALRIIESLTPPVQVGVSRHVVGSGIGIALLPNDGTGPEQLLRKADVALYRAKEERRSAVRFFEEEMDKRVQERQWLEQELRAAVANGDIKPWFQPSVDLKSSRIVGFEVTPRWFHPSQGEITPDRFLPIAEISGLVHELSTNVLRQAALAALKWPENITLSIDMLGSQLHDKKLKSRILEILDETSFPANRLEIEITENALVRDLDAARDILGGLREAGVRIALDNFGTGYSSLYHLRNFKLDKIKIDSSFIHDMALKEESGGIVRALVGLAQGLGITIAAEGIQDPQQQASLLNTGCQHGQGLLYSAPMDAPHTFDVLRGSLLPDSTLEASNG